MSIMRICDLLRSYLIWNGCSTSPTSNPNEVLRYSRGGNEATVTVAKGSQVRLSSQAAADLAEMVDSLRGGKSFQNAELGENDFVSGRRKTILERDGAGCWYCRGRSDLPSYLTIEHLLAQSKGGNWRVENLVLACQPCNNFVGNRSIAEKVAHRESLAADTINPQSQSLLNTGGNTG